MQKIWRWTHQWLEPNLRQSEIEYVCLLYGISGHKLVHDDLYGSLKGWGK
jgi:hypothetical protein